MLKAINTKILLGILAALTLIGGLLIHQNHVNEQAAASAAKAAAILQQQQSDADEVKKKNAQFWEDVKKQKAKQNNSPANSSKTWQHYIP